MSTSTYNKTWKAGSKKSSSVSNGENAQDRALALFAEMMIEKIQQFQGEWKKPWFTEGCGQWPRNLSGRNYNGANSLMLTMLCEKNGYKLPVFATFDRVIALNYHVTKNGKVRIKDDKGNELPMVSVRKGEKSFPVFITTFTVVNKEDNSRVKYEDYIQMSEEQRSKYNVYPKLQTYGVFNIDQTNMQEVRPEMYERIKAEVLTGEKDVVTDDNFHFELMDRMISEGLWECPIRPTKGDNAYYSISKDEIVVPMREQFFSAIAYYGNTLHEMAHSTGAEKRLNRLKPATFGSSEYATEELVAELTAAIVAQYYGMDKYIKEDSVPYLKSWLASLKKNPQFIKTVLMDVKRASSFITQRIDAISAK